MMTFFLAMALHPNIMRKVQHELDAVVGRDRLPTFEDRSKLPFVDAVCREVLRWRPVTPLGAPTSEYLSRISGHIFYLCSCPARDYRRRHLRRILDTQGCVSLALVISMLTDPCLSRRDCNRKFMVSCPSNALEVASTFLG